MTFRKTISQRMSCCGIGLHTGEMSRITLIPNENTGIVFRRNNIETIASPSTISSTFLNTTIGHGRGAIKTIEHLMSALWGCGIDDVIVDVNGPEIPILDGSSSPFVFLIESCGELLKKSPKLDLILPKAIRFGDDKRYIIVRPSNSLRVSFSLCDSNIVKSIDRDTYRSAISRSRTWCNFDDLEFLRSTGHIKGGSAKNAIVLKNGEPIDGSLRTNDELINHKILDIIGDFNLLGRELNLDIVAVSSGHSENIGACLEIMKLLKRSEKLPPSELVDTVQK